MKSLPVAPGRLGPLPHRLQHGPVELVPATLADEFGAVVAPYRAVDPIALLLRRGAITSREAVVADSFRRAFHAAQLEPLRAADLARIPGTRPHSYNGSMGARRHVMGVLTALGGTNALPGSCAWHVIGGEQSVSWWARDVAGIHAHMARGVLVATLVFLAEITRAGRLAHR